VTDIGDSYQDRHKASNETDQNKPKEQESTKDTGGYKRPMAEQETRIEGSQGEDENYQDGGAGTRRDSEGQGHKPRP
jgi:hypothetical protein